MDVENKRPREMKLLLSFKSAVRGYPVTFRLPQRAAEQSWLESWLARQLSPSETFIRRQRMAALTRSAFSQFGQPCAEGVAASRRTGCSG